MQHINLLWGGGAHGWLENIDLIGLVPERARARTEPELKQHLKEKPELQEK